MDAFSNILFHAHSGLRYLVLLAGLLVLVYSLTAVLRGRPWDRPGRVLLSVFVGVMDLQVLLGVVLLVVRLDAFFPALLGHLTLMILAAVIGHVALARNKRRPPEHQSHRLAVAAAGLAIVLIVGGILSIGRAIV